MSQNFFFILLGLPLATIVLVFGMRYFSAMQQAKFRFAHDEAYRELARQAAGAQAETAASLASINVALQDLKVRVAGIEKVLREVE